MVITPRQNRIAEELATGGTYREIAAALGIAYWTVVRHVYNARRRVIDKLPEGERAEARQAAQRRYARALSTGKPVRFRAFSLINGEA